MEKAIKETERFAEWMKNKIQSVHYANHSKMTEAYDRVFQDCIRIEAFTTRTRTTIDNISVTN